MFADPQLCPRIYAFAIGTNSMTSRAIWIAFGLWVWAPQCSANPLPKEAQRLPAEFSCDRVHVEPRMADGKPARFYTDTGGGTWIAADAAARLSLRVTEHADEGGELTKTAALPSFAPDAAIPAVDAKSDPRGEAFRGKLIVVKSDRRL